MPLIKGRSEKALKSNIKTEMEAHPGKEHRAQNLAIAFSTQRAARKKAKAMAMGGEMTKDAEADKHPSGSPIKESYMAPSKKKYMSGHEQMLAMGGELTTEAEADEHPAETPVRESYMRPAEHEYMSEHEQMLAEGGMAEDAIMSMADHIRHKRKMKAMAEGGQVDLEDNNATEHLNEEDQLSFEAGEKELYDLSQLKKQPEDSNERGDEREMAEENEHDGSTVSKIRSKYRKMRD